MKNYVTLNRIKLVREKDVEYDAPHTITCPEDAVEVANAIFDMENLAEETLIVLLLFGKGALRNPYLHNPNHYQVKLLTILFSLRNTRT